MLLVGEEGVPWLLFSDFSSLCIALRASNLVTTGSLQLVHHKSETAVSGILHRQQPSDLKF